MFTKQAQSISIFVGIPEKCVRWKMWTIVPQGDVERTRNYKFVLTSTDHLIWRHWKKLRLKLGDNTKFQFYRNLALSDAFSRTIQLKSMGIKESFWLTEASLKLKSWKKECHWKYTNQKIRSEISKNTQWMKRGVGVVLKMLTNESSWTGSHWSLNVELNWR